MKRKLVLLSLSIFLFTSCLVKSIQPFYISSAIEFDEDLIGSWTDNKKGNWEIESFKTKWEEEKTDNTNITKEDLIEFEKYKNTYYLKYVKNKNDATFFAMPFKVGNHLFLDFIPFEHEADDLNELAAQHLLQTHSTVYVKKNKDGSITIKWLSEKAISNLIKDEKLRIKYEKTGIRDDIVLTAKSSELYSFLEKFMQTDFQNKWDSDDIRTLKPANAKP